VREISQENSAEDSREKFWEGQVTRQRDLAGFGASATMVIASPVVVGARDPIDH